MQPVRTFTSTALTPFQRGIEFGSLHREEVNRTVASYRRVFAARATRPFDVARWGEAAWQAIRERAPDAAEEIAGIAEGAGLPVAEVAVLNARTELLAIADPAGVHECSTVVVLRQGRAPVAVQTWDWFNAMSQGWLHWTIPYPDGRVVSTVTEYGVLAKIGVNSAGVGVLFNLLHHARDAEDTVGFPVHLLSRHMLETCSRVEDALTVARSVTTSASTSLTVVDDAGGAQSIELYPGGLGVVEPSKGLLVRTNHFLSQDGSRGCTAEAIGPGSRLRRDKLLAALGDPERHATASTVVEAMLDHAAVGGVCAHPDSATDPVLAHATLATVVADVVASTLQVRPGGPCAWSEVRQSSRT